MCTPWPRLTSSLGDTDSVVKAGGSEEASPKFVLHTKGTLCAGSKGRLRFTYRPAGSLAAGSRLWLMMDIRQWAGMPQCQDREKPNFVAACTTTGAQVEILCYHVRSLELYPRLPEFLYACEFVFPSGMDQGSALTIFLGSEERGWEFPRHPIPDFIFWLVEGIAGQAFVPSGYKAYRHFEPSLALDSLGDRLHSASVEFEGALPKPSAANVRRTPGILWGDLHGMAFNQRQLDDFYVYARDVAQFDFAAAMLFSYNICVDHVWDGVKAAAARFTRPGAFVAVAGIEFGTPPDGGHRNVHFFQHEGVPPIFCEHRPPALARRHVSRFHPDTVFCQDLEGFYATVDLYGGVVSGHYHTLDHKREVLAEIWQKQQGSAHEEHRIFALLNAGLHLGIVGGSDTHDSMPGNPEPELGCPQTAGLMAVLADEVTSDAIYEAVVSRRVYGTTGARIALYVDVEGQQMGSTLPRTAQRAFRVRVEGTAPLDRVDLVRNGSVLCGNGTDQLSWEGVLEDRDGERIGAHWYLIRVTQRDGHRAWSSPIWCGDLQGGSDD